MPYCKPKLKRAKRMCQYEGCTTEYDAIVSGHNPSKFCLEHRKAQYRKSKKKTEPSNIVEKKKESSLNQIIKHSYKHPMVIVSECQLEGCRKKFDILIVPNTYTYPRFCPEHRNEFKRERFLNGKTV